MFPEPMFLLLLVGLVYFPREQIFFGAKKELDPIVKHFMDRFG